MDDTIKISIGIPTYEAGNSLVKTIETIHGQTGFKNIEEIILVVDGNKIDKKVLTKIQSPKLKVFYSKQREGQSARLNDIFRLNHSKLLVITNDDVLLDKNTVSNIIAAYQHDMFDFGAGKVVPAAPSLFIEKSIAISTLLSNKIVELMGKNDNILSFNGRLVIFEKNFYQNLEIPKKIWNNDAYMYLWSKNIGGKFRYVQGALCYFKSPNSVKEYFNQSNKFGNSLSENAKYFKPAVLDLYHTPLKYIIQSITMIILEKPIETFTFILLNLLKIVLPKQKITNKGFWETDLSTKQI